MSVQSSITVVSGSVARTNKGAPLPSDADTIVKGQS